MSDVEPQAIERLFRPAPEAVAAAVERVLQPGGAPIDPGADLPETGIDAVDALALVVSNLRATERPHDQPTARDLAHPGFFAHMDPPTPWVTWVAAMAAASANQNLLHSDTGEAARRLEARVVSWLAPAFGMDGGHLVPGSSLANLTALWAARDAAGITTVVTSTDAHLSVRKAARILGLDVIAVAPSESGGGLRFDDVEQAVQAAPVDPERIALALTAGTTGLGTVDALPLEPLPLGTLPGGSPGPDQLGGTGAVYAPVGWVHVDAAWAGPLRLSDRHRHILDGVEHADSVSVSAHKWLFQPKESALVLFRDTARANPAISVDAAYLQVPNIGVQGSHGAAAAPLAATLLTLGRTGLAQLIDHCMDLADDLARRIDDRADLVRHPTGGGAATGVIVWRPVGVDAAAVRERLNDVFVSTVTIGGEVWLRSVAANPMADPDRVVAAVVAAADEIRPS